MITSPKRPEFGCYGDGQGSLTTVDHLVPKWSGCAKVGLWVTLVATYRVPSVTVMQVLRYEIGDDEVEFVKPSYKFYC